MPKMRPFSYITMPFFSLLSPLTLKSHSISRHRLYSEVAPSSVNGFGRRYICSTINLLLEFV